MHTDVGLTTERVHFLFDSEVKARGGEVRDAFDDGSLLLARGVLSTVGFVRPGDQVQSGVALKMTPTSIRLVPYTLRQVCTNGALLQLALADHPMEGGRVTDPEQVEREFLDTVEACCRPELFETGLHRMRGAARDSATQLLTALPRLLFSLTGRRTELLAEIGRRFRAEGDRSRYGLAQAVTSLARDTRDPLLKWELEELGGTMLVGDPCRLYSASPFHWNTSSTPRENTRAMRKASSSEGAYLADSIA